MLINENKIDEIIRLVNEDNWDKAFENVEGLNTEELEKLIYKCDIQSFTVEIVSVFLPEDRREKYIDMFLDDSYKLEIVLSLSDDNVKAKYIEQFESSSDKARIVLSFTKRDKLEFVEYLKDAIVEGAQDSKDILSILRDDDIEEILQEEKAFYTEEGHDVERYLAFIIKDIPNDRREKFFKYITNEKYLLRFLLDMPATVIESNSQYVELIVDYINSESNLEKKISAIKLLPKSRLTEEYIEILEQSIAIGRPDESTVLFLIDSKTEKEKYEYIRDFLSKGKLSDNVQKSIGWKIIESICNEAENDKIFDFLCVEYKIKVIDSIEWSEKKVERIKALINDELIEKYINEFSNNPNAVKQFKENFINVLSKADVDKGKKEKQANNAVEVAKIDLIGALSEKKQKDYIDEIMDIFQKFDNKNKVMLLRRLSNELMLEFIYYFDEESDIGSILNGLSEEQRTDYLIANKEKLSEEFKLSKIGKIRNVDLLKKLIVEEELLLPESVGKLRTEYFGSSEGDLPIEFIEENLQWILEKEMSMYGQYDIEDIKRREELIKQISRENEDVWKRIDFRILDDKYVELLGVEKIKVISAFQDEQEKILALSDKKLNIWVDCINEHLKDTESSEWNIVGMDLLDKIESGQYDELIVNIEELSDLEASDIDLLTKLLQTNNIFEIKSVEDLKNYEQIKERKCNELIASDDIENKRLAVLEKLFGQDTEIAKELTRGFKSINSIKDAGIRNYLEELNLILDEKNPANLDEMYRECQSVMIIDKQYITRAIKSEYARNFNDGLFNPLNATKVEGADNLYEAGTDFKMLICVQGTGEGTQMSHTLKDFSKGAKKEWNMPSITSQFMATSYIRDDNIAFFLSAAMRNHSAFIYGFCKMEPSSLLRMYPVDAGTMSHDLSTGSPGSGKFFLAPNDLINETGKRKYSMFDYKYNELNFSRQQSGTKKQPDYIVVFKIDGELLRMQDAKKAQDDWGGELPIVIVDINRCLSEQKRQVEAMKQEYQQTNSPVLARKIYNKIRNNLNTIEANTIKEHFFDKEELAEFEVSDEEIEQYLKEHPKEITRERKNPVTEEELASIYDGVGAEERQSVGNKLKQMYRRIKYIREYGADRAKTTHDAIQKLEDRLENDNDPLIEYRRQAYERLQNEKEGENENSR